MTRMTNQLEKKRYSCTDCVYECSQKSHLDAHSRIHTGDQPFSCKFCSSTFTHNWHLTSHLTTHTGEKRFACHHCEYKAARKEHLKTHIVTHTGQKKFSCGQCRYKTAYKSLLAAHAIKHKGELPFSCSHCDYKCARKCHLTAHLLTHFPLVCNECGYKTTRMRRLVAHSSTHEKRNAENTRSFSASLKNSFSCYHCQFSCARKCYLRFHIIQSHLTTAGSTISLKELKKEDSYLCNYCGFGAALKKELSNHIRTHVSETLFVCALCGFECSRRDDVTILSKCLSCLKTVNGDSTDELYYCSRCEYKAAEKRLLIRHSEKHSEEPTSPCKFCKYECTLRDFCIVKFKMAYCEKHRVS